MSKAEMIITIVVMLMILGPLFVLFLWATSSKNRQTGQELPKPAVRFFPPQEKQPFWTFDVYSYPLTALEYELIYNAGYVQVSCVSEKVKYYPDAGPGTPPIERTKYNYAFKLNDRPNLSLRV